ncbi:predicted protein [Arabidopsis lyrata subsp. lyrata]|uniref:Predicted protein n=1 Tax=Arabidopsis lyrata subsp. lyrata TaxID=81972 RepID=D7M6W8_ARALL|nr:predicted protein [Arabidopsis lyrata subsp. lyrata]
MDLLHGELEEAEKEICNALGNHEKNYGTILDIIDQKGYAVHSQDQIVEDVDVELGDASTDEDLVREIDEYDDGEEVDVDFESDKSISSGYLQIYLQN